MITVDRNKCIYCGGCVGICPVNAMTLEETYITISDACIDCNLCVKFCPVGALEGSK